MCNFLGNIKYFQIMWNFIPLRLKLDALLPKRYQNITYFISTNTKRHILNPNDYKFMVQQYTAGSEEIVLDIFN